jgi:hemolysin activation/secretion protein
VQKKSSSRLTQSLVLSIAILGVCHEVAAAQSPTTRADSAAAPAAKPALGAGSAAAPAVSATSGTPAAAATPAAVATSAAPEARFDIHEYRVLGNTVLANRDIESVLYPLLGDRKTLADVEIARAALEKTFHDRGYGTVFVDIPEQEVDEHIVRLKVTEGRLHEVHIAGARYFSERRILASMPAATEGTVPNLPALQQQLAAVNLQSADRSVVPVLKAGPVPGTVDLALNVDDHAPFHGSLQLDNQNTPGTHQLRATGSLSYTDLFGHFDNLSAQYQVAPDDINQVNVFAANYAWGALENGLHPSVFFINSNSNVPTVGTVGVLGKGQIIGTRLGLALTDAPGMPQSLTFGADYKHFRETIGLAGAPPLVTPISYVNLSVAYSGTWSADLLQGSLSSAANFGPRGAPNDSSAFANKRFKGESNYFYVKIDSSLIAHLPKGFQLVVRADGQYAVEPLITNEDYAIAGADGVRGYLEAEVLADNGVKGSVQFQSPIVQWHTLALGNAFLFYDIGRAGLIDPLPGEPASTTLRSWGGGVNVLPGKWISGSVTWADPLVDGPNTRRGDSRILFVVRGTF